MSASCLFWRTVTDTQCKTQGSRGTQRPTPPVCGHLGGGLGTRGQLAETWHRCRDPTHRRAVAGSHLQSRRGAQSPEADGTLPGSCRSGTESEVAGCCPRAGEAAECKLSRAQPARLDAMGGLRSRHAAASCPQPEHREPRDAAGHSQGTLDIADRRLGVRGAASGVSSHLIT